MRTPLSETGTRTPSTHKGVLSKDVLQRMSIGLWYPCCRCSFSSSRSDRHLFDAICSRCRFVCRVFSQDEGYPTCFRHDGLCPATVDVFSCSECVQSVLVVISCFVDQHSMR